MKGLELLMVIAIATLVIYVLLKALGLIIAVISTILGAWVFIPVGLIAAVIYIAYKERKKKDEK